MKIPCYATLMALLLLNATRAEDVPPIVVPPPLPPVAPQADAAALKRKIDGLIRDLGDRSAKVFTPARKELEAIGKPALPALEALVKSDDASLRRRAQAVINRINAPAQGGAGGGGGAVGMRMNIVPGDAAAPADKPKRPTLQPMSPDMSLDLIATLGFKLGEANGGLRVTDLKAGSPADKAGAMIGDLLTGVNFRVVTTVEIAKEIFSALPSGKVADVDVRRRGENLTLKISNP